MCAFRVTKLYRAWEEPLATVPAGVYIHDDGRPMLGRKLKGRSRRELTMLGSDTRGGREEARGGEA